MYDQIKQFIEQEYGITITNCVDAPRQFVATTYILTISSGEKYFCKIVDKPLFIPHLIESLPILKQLHQQGFDRINYPIATKKGNLYLRQNNLLIVLFNYINALQNYDYDLFTFGQLIASLHQTTSQIDLVMPKEDFHYQYEGIFENQLNQLLTNQSNDQILISLQTLLKKYQTELKHDYDNFMKLSRKFQQSDLKMVITHGDPGGNTLVKTPTDLYLIDGDDILLSPQERDIWFFADHPDFLKGYQSIFPNYQINQELYHYFAYKRYFQDLVEYFAEISGRGTKEHRQKNLQGLEHNCFEGWLRPAIRRFDPFAH